MRSRIKIQDVLEKAEVDSLINLEDSYYVKMLECVKAARWVKLDKEILSMIEYLSDLSTK